MDREMEIFLRISALEWSDILAQYAMFVMQTYLTDVWKVSVTRAAGIMNIWTGIYMMLPFYFLILSDAYLGKFMVVVISSITYCLGISFIAMSTPPVLSNLTGSCEKYKPECVGNTQKVAFYIGMVLLALGMGGHSATIKLFRKEQLNDDFWTPKRRCFRLVTLVFVIPVIGGYCLPFIKPWSIVFGIPAISTAVSTLYFLSGWCMYEKVKPPGQSPVTSICRVLFVAFGSKRSEPFPYDDAQFYRGHSESFTRTRFLRCLEKAAIILPNEVSPDGQVIKNKWKLCSIHEVEEAKAFIRMYPILIPLIFCGLISSIGNSYFPEQANHMNRKIGKLEVPSQVLFLIYSWSTKFFQLCASEFVRRHKVFGSPIRIALAMLSSVLCCITAARIETKRLNVIRSHGLLEKPDEDIPMKVYWLLSQFILLAGLDSFSEKSVVPFFISHVPESMVDYLTYMTKGMLGLGFICSVLSVYVVGQVTNWFQLTLNMSRLDRYYWVLAALSSVNLVVFVVIAMCYRYKSIATHMGLIEVEVGAVEAAPGEEEETGAR